MKNKKKFKRVKRGLKFSVLNEEAIKSIHESSLYLLENIGMKITGDKVLKLLEDNGAAIDDSGITKIPRELVEKALKSVPKEITLYTRDGDPYIVINSKNQVYFGTHADQLEILDPFTGEVRDFYKKDTKMMCTIADYLPNIDFILSVGMSSDIRPEIQSQISFIETVKNFRKPINFSTNDIESLQQIIDIASMIAGGLDKLQEKPFIFNYCEPIPPLTHPIESTEKLYISAGNRIPVVYMPYCMMGGTAPMNFEATLIQCNAEVLTGVVITQLVSEGAPFIYGAMPSIFDMKTTIGSYGAPEFHLLVAAASELSNYYGIPFYGTAGCSDAKHIDEQAMTEVSMEIYSSVLSKANIVHDIGVMDHCNSVSPEMVVLANEIIEGFKHYSQGVEITGNDNIFELIKEAGHGGHYMDKMNTLGNFRDIWYPEFFSRKMINPDNSEIRDKVREKIKFILDNHEVPQLDQDKLDELKDIEDNYYNCMRM